VKIEPAYTLAGVVKLTDGKPLPEKTRVMLGREKAWDNQQVEADEQGRFRFEGVPAEGVSLNVRVKDYRLSEKNASIDPLNTMALIGTIVGDKKDLVVELEPGGRRERMDGSQVAIRNEPLRGAEKVGAVVEGIKVTGKVTDAETGEAIKEFSVVEGRIGPLPEMVDWMRTRKTEGKDGEFTLTFQVPRGARMMAPAAVMIQAAGYLPAKSEKIVGEANLTFALKKGVGPSGVVLKPDGTPAARVRVYMTDMRNGVYVDGDKFAVREQSYTGTQAKNADEDGKFSFEPSVDAYSIIVVDDAGFAEVKMPELKAGQEIRLQPYGRVEGKLMIGKKPGAEETINLSIAEPHYASYPRSFPALSFYAHAKTDADGNFVFERVPPVRVNVYHSPKARDSRTGIIPQAQEIKLALAPGKTEKITLGGFGRPVIGKFVVTGYEGKINWRSDVYSLEAQPKKPASMPDPIAAGREFSEKFRAAKSDEEKAKLRADHEAQQKVANEELRKFYASGAGWKYFTEQTRFALVFAQDGSFRVEDVPGGNYKLRLDLREGGEGPSRYSAPQIARYENDFSIPGEAGERSDEPFDLGVIEIGAKAVLKAGKLAPEFETATLNGKTIRLSDYKGKYLLLDFWAVWCGPCVAETPYLKEAYEAFKDNPKFAMVGLSLDPEKDEPIQYQKKNQLGWTQGFLGDWAKSDIPNKFGVEGIPAIFLIGPDGTILKRDLRGDMIKAAIQSALSPKN
jgi:peroxiredoxin